jgi:hypothetical protein
MDSTTLKDVTLTALRPEAEPRAVQIDAWLGDVYLGQRTYYAEESIANAKRLAKRYIQQNGSLH